MGVYNGTYQKRMGALWNKIFVSGYSVDDILKKYENQYFKNTKISKKVVFEQVLNLKLSNETFNFLEKCGSNLGEFSDVRRAYEYATDLIIGWISEDVILKKLEDLLRKNKMDVDIKLNGSDRNRDFLQRDEIKSQPDIMIGGRTLEVVDDWFACWTSSSPHWDLRNDKYNKLVKEQSLVIGFSSETKEGIFIDFKKDNPVFFQNKVKAWGYKQGYTTTDVKKYLHPIDNAYMEIIKLFK